MSDEPKFTWDKVDVRTDKWKRLQQLMEQIEPHEHYDGMNECRVCDEPLTDALIRQCEKLLSLREQAGEPASRSYKCGCVLCICEDEERCHGCGAKSCGKSDAECGWKQERIRAVMNTAPPVQPGAVSVIDFYEREFYPLSNFSAFRLWWKSRHFHTSEAAYQWEKFDLGAKVDGLYIRDAIHDAESAHDAFKLAEKYKALRRADWDAEKVNTMRDILRAKAEQHEYVRRKLLETGTRTLVECSWRDDFWGWGPNRDGQNMLGKLWMEIRDELRAAVAQEQEGKHG